MNKRLLVLALASACLLGAAPLASAAKLVVVNGDVGTGKGLDDPTPKTPQGGNPGTTLGEQRRLVYQYAADLWGTVMKSNVDIKVGASFQPLTCDATSAVLGSAGPNWIDRDFPNAPLPGYWYHSALADSLAGVDLDPVADDPLDIVSRFNGDIGVRADCLTGSNWYYGLDGKTPAGNINFLNVVMHEISHGLGFSGFINKTTGAFIDADGTGPKPDAYSHNAFDNVVGKRFDAAGMTDAIRALAMRTPGRLVWTGSNVVSQAALLLDDKVLLKTSGTLTTGYEFGTAAFGPAATTANFTGSVKLANDGVGDTADACEPLPAGSLTGKIAFINRGTCSFEPKVVNAQNAGAIAVIVGNVATSAPGLITMADDATVTATIPAVLVVVDDANAIKAALPGVNVSLGVVPGRLAGADTAGRVQLYAPTTVASGSTFSHYDTALSPNVLMEPFITSTLNAQYNVDLTPALFNDIGWGLNSANVSIGSCPTQVPALATGGLIAGANVVAQSNLCETSSSTPARYLQCMLNYANAQRKSGVLTTKQATSVQVCAAKRASELQRQP